MPSYKGGQGLNRVVVAVCEYARAGGDPANRPLSAFRERTHCARTFDNMFNK